MGASLGDDYPTDVVSAFRARLAEATEYGQVVLVSRR
jgi:hypothetical protein